MNSSSIALQPCDLGSVPELVEQINDLGTRLAGGDLHARHRLLKSARDLVSALETPRETMIKHCWAQPTAFTVIEICIEIGLFKALSLNSGVSKKSDDLALQVGVDPLLVARFLRHLGAMGYVKETGPDEYKPTNFSNSLTIPIIGDGYPLVTESIIYAFNMLPEYLRETGYRVPADLLSSPYQYAHKTNLNMFEHLHTDPVNFGRFHNHMAAYRQGRDSWSKPLAQ
jgi:hypothetical protein